MWSAGSRTGRCSRRRWCWRDNPDWAVLSRPVRVLALVSAAALVVFASGIAGPYNGVVQRIAVTLPLTAEILIAGCSPCRYPVPLPCPASHPARERQPIGG
jgi:hypothetical protein